METITLPSLDVGVFDPFQDSITIDGTIYSGNLFRSLGINAMIGQIIRIDKHENGLVTCTRMHELE